MSHTIKAAGAVLWRGSPEAPEVALIHRGRYNDWTFPKGKLDPGEHTIVAAVREVWEETGSRIRLGPPLPRREYRQGADTKRVDYWCGEYLDGAFEPNDEVDALEWMSVDQARHQLTHAGDQPIIEAFELATLTTVPVVMVRHALAEPRGNFAGDDRLRPLTPEGGHQSETLAHALSCAFAPLAVVSSPWLRCLQTVSPYAGFVRQPLMELDVLGESEFDDDPEMAQETVAGLIAHNIEHGVGTLLCSHGNVMSALLQAVGLSTDTGTFDKGEFAIAHVDSTSKTAISLERHLP